MVEQSSAQEHLYKQCCCCLTIKVLSPHDVHDWACRAEGPPPRRRERLPPPKQKEKSVSLWAILKEVVGKDLSKVPVRVLIVSPAPWSLTALTGTISLTTPKRPHCSWMHRWHAAMQGARAHGHSTHQRAVPVQVCLPVYFNEPLSALQKMAEELEYSELVDKVQPEKQHTRRMLVYI